MGCAASKDTSVLEGLRAAYPKMLSILELQQYAQDLGSRFIEANLSTAPGTLPTLTMAEFLTLLGVPKNRVSVRLFAIVDMDGSGTLDFRELCYALWQLCTLDNDGLRSFLFDLYDEYNNGSIEYDDVERMFLDAYGKMEGEDLEDLIGFVKEAGSLGRHAFNKFCERCPQAMKQLVDVQRNVRTNILGMKVWLDYTERRKRKTDPYFRPENWSLLMERIIVMDSEARDAIRAREDAEDIKFGRHNRRHLALSGGLAKREVIKYEP